MTIIQKGDYMYFFGFGTILNVLLAISGGIIGLFLGEKVKKELKDTLLNAAGCCLLFMSISGAISQMLIIKNNLLVQSNILMMMVSISVGSIIGELINIQGFVENFGLLIKKLTKSDKDNSFVNAFIFATCTVCIGAMAVIGAIEDAINHNYNILLAKGIMDFIILGLLSASLGKGAVFSAVSIFLFQGIIEIISALLGPFISKAAINNISYIGNILIFAVAVNILWDKKIRVTNMLPSLIIAALWSFFSN